MPKEPTITIKVSVATYNEISSELEKQGFKIDVNVANITLERGTKLEHPIDYRLATIRRDCVTAAARAYGHNLTIEQIDEIFKYVLMGMPPTTIDLVTNEVVQPQWK